MATLHLTDRAVQSLTSEQGVMDVRDTQFKGFGVRVTDRGTKSFFVIYPVGGRRKRLSLGRYPIVSLADARAKARQALAEVANGADPQAEKRAARIGLRMDEVAQSFVTLYSEKHHSPAWRREVGRLLDKEILPTLGSYRITDVTRQDVNLLLDRIAKRGPVLANRVRAVLSKLFSWAVSRDIIEHSPVVGVAKRSRERSRERVLTADEIRKVWEACDAASSLVAVTVQLVLVTAQRGGEVRSMRWADIADSWWTIPQTKSKGGHSHRVFLSPLAEELLSTLDPETEYVFPGARGRAHMTYPYKAFKLVHEAAGIPHWTIHDLRRTAATMMTSMKISPFIVERILGHTDKRITAVYDRSSYDDEKREAMVLWGEKLRELTT